MKAKVQNRMKLEFDSLSENESFARSAVCTFAAQLDPTVPELTEIRTAVSEAVTNCVVHGYSGRKGKISVTVILFSDRRIKIKISDRGCGIKDIEQARKPLYTSDPTGERGGMGFSIMENFTDAMKISSKPDHGTTVTLIKRLRG